MTQTRLCSNIAPLHHEQAEITSEAGQMYSSFHEYVKDEWNWLESLSLLLLAGALFYRIGNSDGSTGRALFSLSAPLVFSRVLFFGQVLRRQGLVVQVNAAFVSAERHGTGSTRHFQCPSLEELHAAHPTTDFVQAVVCG